SMALGATSIFVCTIHYFGILSLLLVAACEFLFHRPQGPGLYRGLVAMGLGPVAFLAWFPIMIQQRSALTASPWALPSDWASMVRFGLAFVAPLTAVAAACVLAARQAACRKSKPTLPHQPEISTL